jgi:hypothetical protein
MLPTLVSDPPLQHHTRLVHLNHSSGIVLDDPLTPAPARALALGILTAAHNPQLVDCLVVGFEISDHTTCHADVYTLAFGADGTAGVKDCREPVVAGV